MKKILLVVYDNASYMTHFPLGTAYIASALHEYGHYVEIWDQAVEHWPDSDLTTYLDNNYYDYIGISVIGGYYQYKKLLLLTKAINKSTNRPQLILGGHGPTPDPAYFMRVTGADYVVMGEGETTIAELLNGVAPSEIRGLAYRADEVVINPRQEPILLDSLSYPLYDLFNMDYYRLFRRPHIQDTEFCMPVLTSRGCPFHCNFCYRMDPGYRLHTVEYVIKHIKFLQERYRISYISFADELFMFSEKRTKEFCYELGKLNIHWECQGRLNFATPEILKLMKGSGCVFINYGIESMSDEVLKTMNKNLTVKQIRAGIQATLDAGISPGFNIIWGNIGETKDDLTAGVKYLLTHDDGAQLRTIRPVTPYPGSALFNYAVEKGLVKDVADFYENKHTNADLLAVNFTQYTDNQFHRALHQANNQLLFNYYMSKYRAGVETTTKLYIDNDVTFRGFRQT